MSPSLEVVKALAEFMGMSLDDLLKMTDGDQVVSIAPKITDEDIKFALFGGAEDITDAQYEEVKRFARYVRERDKFDNNS